MAKDTYSLNPSHYTKRDGGTWIPWDGEPITNMKFLTTPKGKTSMALLDNVFRKVYAIKFENNPTRSNKIPRWDCSNGWTTKPNTKFWLEAII